MAQNRFIEVADQLLRRISDELAVPLEDRPSGVDRANLEFASEHVQAMKNAVAEDLLPRRNQRYAPLTRMICDQWPLRCGLENQLSELESWYMKI